LIDSITTFLGTTHELTPLSFAVLVLAFLASGFVLLPRAVLCVLAGAAFGLIAIPIAIPTMTLGALGAFLTSRYLLGDFVRQRIARRALLARLSSAVDQEGWRIVALMRLGAPIPGAITNYVFGLTNISVFAYVWATFLFCIPQIVLFACLGAAGRAAVLDDSASAVSQGLIALAVITSGMIVFLVTRRARAIFAELRE
jgi:uncharacterized membrane protein YdjX (TVP38/TMEM64 family)